MAIDRIGKGSVVPPSAADPRAASLSVPASHPAASPSSVSETEAARNAGIEPAARAVSSPEVPATAGPSGALQRLRAGEIDVHGYLDLKVEEATLPLAGLSAHEIDAIKQMLKDQLLSDPGLADLVQQATGMASPLDE